MACGRELAGVGRTLYSSHVAARGLGLESCDKPVISFPRPREMGPRISSISRNCSFRSLNNSRGMLTLLTAQPPHRRLARFELGNSALSAMVSNQVHIRRLNQIERHLISKPWAAQRSISVSTTSGSTPPQESFIRKLIEKLIQFIVALLPSKRLVEKVEEDIDAVAAVVSQATKVVVEVADEVEEMANVAEMTAEEIEKMAHRVQEITAEVQKVVDDVADVLEGEKGASTLIDTFERMKANAGAVVVDKGAGTTITLKANSSAGALKNGAATVITLKTNASPGAVHIGAAKTTTFKGRTSESENDDAAATAVMSKENASVTVNDNGVVISTSPADKKT